MVDPVSPECTISIYISLRLSLSEKVVAGLRLLLEEDRVLITDCVADVDENHILIDSKFEGLVKQKVAEWHEKVTYTKPAIHDEKA